MVWGIGGQEDGKGVEVWGIGVEVEHKELGVEGDDRELGVEDNGGQEGDDMEPWSQNGVWQWLGVGNHVGVVVCILRGVDRGGMA